MVINNAVSIGKSMMFFTIRGRSARIAARPYIHAKNKGVNRILHKRFTRNFAAATRHTLSGVLYKNNAKIKELSISTSVNGGKKGPLGNRKLPSKSDAAPAISATNGPYIKLPKAFGRKTTET